MNVTKVVRALQKIAGHDAVITSPEERVVYECDGLTCFKALPDIVVLPHTTEQVSRIVALCHTEKIPFLARGAGTGLSGGALPVEGGVMIVLTRMNRILEVDYANQRATVEPGAINISLTERVSPQGYYYAPDPSSQQACSIGGNVAENSGGPHCLKYGVTVNHVLGLEVVLPDGEVVEIGGKVAESPGYDLTGLFVGSEGTLGIATKIIVRILKRPEAVTTLLAAMEAVEDASAAVSGIIAAGIIPAAIEMMDRLSIQAVEEAVHAGYPTDAGAVLLVEVDGPREEVEALTPLVREVCEKNRAREVRLAQTETERALLWKGRKGAFGAMGRLSPDYYVQDGVIPRTKLPEVLAEIQKLGAEYNLRVANVFHAGDGNLHPLILYDARNPGEFERTEALGAAIMKVCIGVGGTITGEHGVGFEKKDFMPWLFTPEDLEAMQRVKTAFNPTGLCNPGKIFPTSKSCVEVGRGGRRPLAYVPHRIEREGLAQRF